MFPDHLHMAAKLFLAALTKITAATSDEIVNANAVSGREVRHVRANFFHAASNFVPECQRYRIIFGNAGEMLHVGATNPRSRNANKTARRADLGNWNARLLERFSDLQEP